MTGLTCGEYDLEGRKRSKGEKVFLMKSVRDLINPRRSSNSVREAERRSLFASGHDSTSFRASIEHLCQNAKRMR